MFNRFKYFLCVLVVPVLSSCVTGSSYQQYQALKVELLQAHNTSFPIRMDQIAHFKVGMTANKAYSIIKTIGYSESIQNNCTIEDVVLNGGTSERSFWLRIYPPNDPMIVIEKNDPDKFTLEPCEVITLVLNKGFIEQIEIDQFNQPTEKVLKLIENDKKKFPGLKPLQYENAFRWNCSKYSYVDVSYREFLGLKTSTYSKKIADATTHLIQGI